MFAPQPDGSAVTFWADAARTADELRSRSAKDAERYPEFDRVTNADFTIHQVKSVKEKGKELALPKFGGGVPAKELAIFVRQFFATWNEKNG